MSNIKERSIDPATQEVLKKAQEENIRTAWDRLEAQEPQCGFGQLGVCCTVCAMGPCRIDPFGEGAQVGVCGASADTIAARNLARKIAVGASGGIHIAYVDYTPGNGEIFYKESSNGGSAWLAPVRLTWNTSDSSTPRIAVDKNGGVHVVWRNVTWHSAAWEIFYRNRGII